MPWSGDRRLPRRVARPTPGAAGVRQRGWIHDATRVHDGSDPEAVIADMLADPSVAEIHSRNIAWGCYMFRVTRATG